MPQLDGAKKKIKGLKEHLKRIKLKNDEASEPKIEWGLHSEKSETDPSKEYIFDSKHWMGNLEPGSGLHHGYNLSGNATPAMRNQPSPSYGHGIANNLPQAFENEHIRHSTPSVRNQRADGYASPIHFPLSDFSGGAGIMHQRLQKQNCFPMSPAQCRAQFMGSPCPNLSSASPVPAPEFSDPAGQRIRGAAQKPVLTAPPNRQILGSPPLPPKDFKSYKSPQGQELPLKFKQIQINKSNASPDQYNPTPYVLEATLDTTKTLEKPTFQQNGSLDQPKPDFLSDISDMSMSGNVSDVESLKDSASFGVQINDKNKSSNALPPVRCGQPDATFDNNADLGRAAYSSVFKTHQSPDDSELDKLWMPGYYGEDEEDIGLKSAFFSNRRGNIKLRVGKRQAAFDVTWNDGCYEMKIDGHIFTGRNLSKLAENVNQFLHGDERITTDPRKCASRIYLQDLISFAGTAQIEKSSLDVLIESIARGSFGEVALAEYTTSYAKSKVAIKRIHQDSTHALVGAMEIAVLLELAKTPNDNIIQLMGWYLDTDALCIVTEYTPGENLADYISRNYTTGEYIQLIDFYEYARQIAIGMRVLEERKIEHRNLAAQNILLGTNKTPKIAGFGLSRPQGSRYTSGVIAVKWAAMEVIEGEGKCTIASDVWSYGVVLWEIYSVASLPYNDVDDSQMLEHLRAGNRLERPLDTPDSMYSIMLECWSEKPADRPTFSNICDRLKGRRKSLRNTINY